MCRLTIQGPSSRVELAVPAHIPLADLLPTFLDHLGGGLGNAGLEHDGWVLQRLGEPALQEDLGTAALGLYDGDILHLRPRNDQLPPADFDDLADGVATGIRNQRKDLWRPESTRRAFLALLGASLALGLVLLPSIGAGQWVAITAGSVALVLLGAAALSSRALGDRAASELLFSGSAAFAAAAGWALPMIGRPVIAMSTQLVAPCLTAAAVCTSVIVLGRFLVGGGFGAGYLAAMLATGLTALVGLLNTFDMLSAGGAAAVVLAVTLLVGTRVPRIAAWLAGLKVPPLPTSAEQFQEGIDPEPGRELMDRTAEADFNLTALCAGLGVVIAGCLGILAFTPGWASPTLAAIASFLLLLHSREFASSRQRVAVMVPGFLGLAAVITALCLVIPGAWRIAVIGALIVLSGLLLAGARSLPGRRMLPHWGRAGDWAHMTLAIAIVPMTLAALNLYAVVRAAWS
ncbi:type VII secretion integral membrane protein EccD [Saccharopolyspora sp. TS4A08]|uniref:Type VII secretion integral membrane protein EccD n=1 Tax=Saccharopolyspora ipomoeae TaxID=3042027 RepID=A0ABT6PHS9_9PSEU|nr:type VII secretion integral membrane protein EccD [Saccharopolyspora sp. TS4A08]MDI2027558.1 type VII secretion integral membrane protein EccD [Saccharopolyspora sp. TS4A08]